MTMHLTKYVTDSFLSSVTNVASNFVLQLSNPFGPSKATGSVTKICTSFYILARDTETLAALTYKMANRCEVIIAADGDAPKYYSFWLLTFNQSVLFRCTNF